ncbi:hypothetical protein GLOIN_2v1480642 [Rhizophagus irregularis DAOM 181602=DAOM 197198]|nr:hypothetical protein GLOIN_2v1480642 [Rhizophagus irregularis DAOM 181602=DAOM 197198]
MPKSNRCSSTPKYPRVETIQEQELEGENKQVYASHSNQKGHIKGGIARMGTNSALRASSSAIKRVMEGRIAHLGHQFGTSCFIPGNQKVRKWIVKCLRQIDGLQIRHFVPHPAIKWASPNLRPTDTPDRILNIP